MIRVEPETAATPTSAARPPELAWEAEPDEIPTSTPFVASWRLVAALAVSIFVAATLLIGSAWVWTHRGATESLGTTPTVAPSSIAATPSPPALTTTVPAPPPVTVTVTQSPASAPTAAPQVPAIAQEICSTLRQHPGMYPMDVALSLSMDQHRYRDYDHAMPVVENAVANYCPDQNR